MRKLKKLHLWFDSDLSTTVAEKLKSEMPKYEAKYGIKPKFCFVNPVQSGRDEIDGIEIRPTNALLPHHFMMGA